MLYLSKNFTLDEFVKSDTAKKYHIDNKPNKEQLINMIKFCRDFLQPFRDKINTPIMISSGFRCKKLNDILKGVKNSQHLFLNNSGAVDIYCKKYTTLELYKWVKNNDILFDQLILERPDTNKKGWVHISYNLISYKNRKEKLIYDGLKYKKDI